MYIFTLAIYSVDYLLISREDIHLVMKKMSQVPEPQNLSEAPVVVYPDTGESGETYDIEFRTLPSVVPFRLLELFFSLKTPSGQPVDSETGGAYRPKAEAIHQNGDP